MQEILIESIRTDSGVQSRAEINREYVAELAEQLKAGRRLPPVEVYRDGAETWMADGFHRLQAHVEAGKRTIRAEIHKGGRAEARWASIGANLEHGLRRTNADKRRAVTMALEDRPQASDQLIADHCGVSSVYVQQTRRTLASQGVNCLPPERIGRDGKTYRIPPPPPPAPQRVTPTEAHQKPRIPPPPPPPPPTKPAAPPPPAKAGPVDEVGHQIPDHLQELFWRSCEVQALLTKLSDVRGTIKGAGDDPLYFEVDAQAVASGIAQAYDAIKATTPYAVCPWCRGKAPMQATCRGCGTRGVIGRFRWDTTVPKEMK